MISRRKNRVWCVALWIFLISTLAPIGAPAQGLKQIIVKGSPEDLERVRASVGGAVVDAIPGHYLLSVPASTDVNAVKATQGKGPIQASENSAVSIHHPRPASTGTSVPSLGVANSWYGTPAHQGYTEQWAVGKISLNGALDIATGTGVRVAIIDTGVDEHNPTLKSVLLGGKNYIGPTAVPDELIDPVVIAQSSAGVLDQSSAGVLDQSSAGVLDQSSAGILDQSSAGVLDQSSAGVLDGAMRLPEFSHGTMMAGLVHLVAPYARIVPLKVFDASGTATEWNIVRAIYDAVNVWQADVISMSFSTTKRSEIVEAALEYAASHNVGLAAAAGNDNTDQPTYPGAFDSVLGVSALTQDDQKTSFSDFGSYVSVSAPGCYVSTYYGGHWAWGCGTSGSAAMTAGVAALVAQHSTAKASLPQRIESGVDPINVPPQYHNKLGKGRINALKAVRGGSEN
jgi:hypothetical protein